MYLVAIKASFEKELALVLLPWGCHCVPECKVLTVESGRQSP